MPAAVAWGVEGPTLPSWFWDTPQIEGVPIAVGYASPYYQMDSSYSEAFEEAVKQLWVDRKCKITAKTGFFSIGDETFHMGGTYDVEADTSGFAGFKASCVRIDSCWTDSLVLILVGTDWIKVDRSLIPPPEGDWLNLPSHFQADAPEYYYGQGVATEYFKAAFSWRAAEQNARRNLAFSAITHFRSEQLTLNERMSRTTDMSSEAVFHDIQTVARRWDEKFRAYSVVVAAPKAGIEAK